MSHVVVEPKEEINYNHEELQPTRNLEEEQVDITVYVNSRGTMSPIKTLGYSPITLRVHKNYHMLEPKGKALFRKNAYNEYLAR